MSLVRHDEDAFFGAADGTKELLSVSVSGSISFVYVVLRRAGMFLASCLQPPEQL